MRRLWILYSWYQRTIPPRGCDISLHNSPHLVHVPSLGTLTARSLTGGDLEVLGGETDGSLDAELLGLGTLNELAADLLEGGDLARGEGDADLVDLGSIALRSLLGVLERHFCSVGRRVLGYAITTGRILAFFWYSEYRIAHAHLGLGTR